MSKLGGILSNPEMSEKIKSIIEASPPPKSPAETDIAVKPVPAPISSGGITGGSVPRTIINGRALLTALKPFLDKERCEKIDRILSAMKLAEFAGIFRNLI